MNKQLKNIKFGDWFEIKPSFACHLFLLCLSSFTPPTQRGNDNVALPVKAFSAGN